MFIPLIFRPSISPCEVSGESNFPAKWAPDSTVSGISQIPLGRGRGSQGKFRKLRPTEWKLTGLNFATLPTRFPSALFTAWIPSIRAVGFSIIPEFFDLLGIKMGEG